MSLVYTPNDNITILDAQTFIANEYRGVTDEVVINLNAESKDFKDARGNKYQSIDMVAEISGTVKVRDITLRNLLLGLKGTSESLAGDTHTVTATFEADKVVFLPHMYVSGVAVTKGGVAVDPAQYEVVQGHGYIKPLHADALGAVSITYTYGEQTQIGMLNGTSPVVPVDFAVTRLHDDSPLRVGLYRAKFKPQKQLALAGTDYAGLDLEFTALARTDVSASAILGKYGYVFGRI